MYKKFAHEKLMNFNNQIKKRNKTQQPPQALFRTSLFFYLSITF